MYDGLVYINLGPYFQVSDVPGPFLLISAGLILHLKNSNASKWNHIMIYNTVFFPIHFNI